MAEPDPLERLEQATLAIAIRSTWEQNNRRGLLWVHAVIAITAAAQMVLYGGPPNIEALVGTWVRPVLAMFGFLGGFTLASGLVARPRSVWKEIAGLVIIGLWDSAMTIGIALSRIQAGDYTVRGLLEPEPAGHVTSYAVSVYAGLLALIVIHLITLTKLLPRRRRHLWIHSSH